MYLCTWGCSTLGHLSIRFDVPQSRHGGVNVQPSSSSEPKNSKSKSKLLTTPRTSATRTQKVQGRNIETSPGKGTKPRFADALPRSSPMLSTSREALGQAVAESSISSTSSRPGLEVQHAPKPTKSDEVAYTIQPGDSQIFTLPNGHVLGYAEYGSRSPSAKVVYAFRGTPGSRLEFKNFHEWGIRNNVKFVCPERPGYGLSTVQRGFTICSHAQDVHCLRQHLGHRETTAYGISGGGPYALAYTHQTSHQIVTGTMLVVPSIPRETFQQRIPRHPIWYLKARFFPTWLEEDWRVQPWTAQKYLPEDSKSVMNKEFRKSKEGRKLLGVREKSGEPAGHVGDYRELIFSSWGFKCRDVDAKNILIFAGGFDVNVAAPEGAQYMRDHLRNSRLRFLPMQDHYAVQDDQYSEILEALKQL